jgi:hypothetical protein
MELPAVIKPAFGGAGFGFRVVSSSDMWQAQQRIAGEYLRHGGCVVEPWCDRVADLSTSVHVHRNGAIGPVVFQRQRINSYGAFYGMYSADDDRVITPWRAALEKTTRLLAEAAADRGYFGPIGVDSFVYRDRSGAEVLASGIEVNGRFTMGMLAHEFRSRIATGQHTLLRFIGKKRCRLPASIGEWLTVCGADIAYNRTSRSGIIAITPMRIGYRGTWSQPQRSAFFIVGDTLDQLETFDRELRMRISAAPAT